jgi:hypothetical protein
VKARPAAIGAAVAVVIVAVAAVAAWHETAIGAREYAAADEAASRGDWPSAVDHARAAAEAVAPASPWPERALRRLEAIARDAETRGDAETARLAYAAMWTAVSSTRSSGDSGGKSGDGNGGRR